MDEDKHPKQYATLNRGSREVPFNDVIGYTFFRPFSQRVLGLITPLDSKTMRKICAIVQRCIADTTRFRLSIVEANNRNGTILLRSG